MMCFKYIIIFFAETKQVYKKTSNSHPDIYIIFDFDQIMTP